MMSNDETSELGNDVVEKNRYEELEAEYADLAKDYDDLSKECDDILAENEILKRDYNKLVGKYNELLDDYDILSKKLSFFATYWCESVKNKPKQQNEEIDHKTLGKRAIFKHSWF